MTMYREQAESASRIYVGVDVHKRSWQVTIRTFDVKLGKMNMPASWEALAKVLERYRGQKLQVVYEAGFCGSWLYDRLMAWGAECIVTPRV